MFRILFFALVLLAFSHSISAQNTKSKADRAFENLEYYEAIPLYQKHLEKNGRDDESQMRLAQCFLKTNQFYTAEAQYANLKRLFPRFPNLQLDYADLLMKNGKMQEAKGELNAYLEKNGEDARAQNLLKSINERGSLMASENRFSLEKAFFNSEVADFSPVFYKDGIVFTSEGGGKTDPWTGRSFTNLFFVKENGRPQLLSGSFDGKYHNGTACFTDENTMLYTRNSSSKNKRDEFNLMISEAVLKGGEWVFTKDFPYNSQKYNVAYPAVSPDGQMLVFASDMPGGKGGMDLYFCKKVGLGWSAPTNLSSLNTLGDDVFPTFTPEGQFFYATDGRVGLGGLDIFSADFENGVFSNIKNMGAPHNSSRDDFGLISNDGLKTGYFSSNRGTDAGVDNIYFFRKNKSAVQIHGIVVDEWTKMPLKETTVTLTNTKTGEKADFFTDEDGRFSFDGQSEMSYGLQGEKNGILTTLEQFNTNGKDENDKLYYTLLHNDPRFSLEGFAINVKTEKGVEGVEVKRFNKTQIAELEALTDEKGFFRFQLEQNSDFEISGMKDGYYTSISEASTKGLDRSTTLYVKLILSVEEVVIGETKIMGKEQLGGWDFENIYYDLDKHFIRPDAAAALDKVVKFMEANPKLQIEMGAHTDCRASDSYNQTLSQKRAEAAVAYVVSKGVSRSRISARGYGESRLVNRCADGVKCSEAEHQENRRTEIMVVGK